MVRDLLDHGARDAGTRVLRRAAGNSVVADHRIVNVRIWPHKTDRSALLRSGHARIEDRLAEGEAVKVESVSVEREPSARKRDAGAHRVLRFCHPRHAPWPSYGQLVWTGSSRTAFATALTIIDPIGMIPLTLTTTQKSQSQPARTRRGPSDHGGGAGHARHGRARSGGAAHLALRSRLHDRGRDIAVSHRDGHALRRPTGARRTAEEEREGQETENPAVFPLAIPMIAGPGTIATVLLLAISRTAAGQDRTVFLAYAAALAITWAACAERRTISTESATPAFTSSRVCSESSGRRCGSVRDQRSCQTPLLTH